MGPPIPPHPGAHRTNGRQTEQLANMDTDQDADELRKIRHGAAHVMAQAVLERYPDAKLGFGPPIEAGFYYDFDLGTSDEGQTRTFTPDDLEKIEARMREIIREGHPFIYREVTADEARSLFATQPYKLELIDGLATGEVDEY